MSSSYDHITWVEDLLERIGEKDTPRGIFVRSACWEKLQGELVRAEGFVFKRMEAGYLVGPMVAPVEIRTELPIFALVHHLLAHPHEVVQVQAFGFKSGPSARTAFTRTDREGAFSLQTVRATPGLFNQVRERIHINNQDGSARYVPEPGDYPVDTG